MKPTAEELNAIDPASRHDQDAAEEVARRLDKYFGDGDLDYYETLKDTIQLIGKEATLRHLAASWGDWQPEDIGCVRLVRAMANRAERELRAMN